MASFSTPTRRTSAPYGSYSDVNGDVASSSNAGGGESTYGTFGQQGGAPFTAATPATAWYNAGSFTHVQDAPPFTNVHATSRAGSSEDTPSRPRPKRKRTASDEAAGGALPASEQFARAQRSRERAERAKTFVRAKPNGAPQPSLLDLQRQALLAASAAQFASPNVVVPASNGAPPPGAAAAPNNNAPVGNGAPAHRLYGPQTANGELAALGVFGFGVGLAGGYAGLAAQAAKKLGSLALRLGSFGYGQPPQTVVPPPPAPPSIAPPLPLGAPAVPPTIVVAAASVPEVVVSPIAGPAPPPSIAAPSAVRVGAPAPTITPTAQQTKAAPPSMLPSNWGAGGFGGRHGGRGQRVHSRPSLHSAAPPADAAESSGRFVCAGGRAAAATAPAQQAKIKD